jgi:hypothetical protein
MSMKQLEEQQKNEKKREIAISLFYKYYFNTFVFSLFQ